MPSPKGWSGAALAIARKMNIELDPEMVQAAITATTNTSDEEAINEMRMRVDTAFVPTERQAAFLESEAFETLFGGAAGGGKSMAAIGLGLKRSLLPNHTTIMFRKTYPQINGSDGLAQKSMSMYPIAGGQYNGGNLTWFFPATSARVQFRHMSDSNAYLNYQGLAYQLIAFDELTQFNEFEYLYLISRARSSDPRVTPIIRATANPGGPGHDFVLKRWNAWLNPAHPNPAAPGEIRWYLRAGDSEIEVEPGTRYARSRTFIPSLLTDNPYLMHDDEYMGNLMSLPELERQQLLNGNWTIKISAGMFFQRGRFVDIRELPAGDRIILRCRYWDRAATEPSPQNKDPDWTVGVMIALGVSGTLYVEDMVRFRLGPGDTVDEVCATVRRDALRWPLLQQVLETDPGQAGKVEQMVYETLLPGYNVSFNRVTTNKQARAKNAAVPVQQGKVAIVDGPWRTEFMNELEAFPLDAHDDIVDAFSGAVNFLTGQQPASSEDYQV